MMDVMVNLIIFGYELYLLYGFGRSLLGLGGGNPVFRFLVNGFIYAIYITVNSLTSSMPNLVILPGIYMIFSFWNFSGSILKKVLLSVCYYTLIILPEGIFTLIANVNSDFYDYRNYRDEFFIIFIIKMFTFLLVRCIEQIHKQKYYEGEQHRTFLSLLVLPLSTIVFLCYVFYLYVYNGTSLKSMILIGAVLLLFANGFMFHLFNKMLINEDKAHKSENLYIKSNMEKRYLEQLIDSDKEQKKLMHDINKYVRTAANCIVMGNIEEAKSLFNKLDLKIQETKPIKYSNNKILNVMLTDRKQSMAKEGIAFSVKIEPEVDLAFMDDMDLIAIWGNLLDNAFEAASMCGKEGFVKVGIFTENDGHFLMINIDNTYKNEPIYGHKGYVTTKKEQRNHGIGIYTVERIVERYGGRLSIGVKKELKNYEVTIIFQL